MYNQEKVTTMIDRQLRNEIIAEVRKSLTKANERWVTADTLCQHVEVLTPRWLKSHGQMLNRTRVEWTDDKGKHTSSWMYPLNEIIQMVHDGSIRNLGIQ